MTPHQKYLLDCMFHMALFAFLTLSARALWPTAKVELLALYSKITRELKWWSIK